MILSSLTKLKQKGVNCHQQQIWGVTLTSDRLNPCKKNNFIMSLLAVPDFTSRSCQMKRYAMVGWQLSYFTNVCAVQLEVSFTPHGDRTSKLQQELMLQYNSSLRY